jgi:hypothetical protein
MLYFFILGQCSLLATLIAALAVSPIAALVTSMAALHDAPFMAVLATTARRLHRSRRRSMQCSRACTI